MLTLVPGRYFYPDGQFYGRVWRIVDDSGNIVASYASEVQAEQRLAAENASAEEGRENAV